MITENQRKDRLKGLGGSDMGVILGLSSYKTPYQLFLEKTGYLNEPYEENKFQEWGNRLEPIIRLKFSEKHGVKVQAPKEEEKTLFPCSLITHPLETIIHPEYSFLRANLDGFIPEWNSVLEIKCAMQFMEKEWGESGSDTIPLSYLVQVAHYVACTDADSAHIAVLIGGNDYREFIYHRDTELEKHVINAASEFWKAVETNTAPPILNIDDARLMYPFSKEKTILTNEECNKALSEIKEIRKKQKELLEIENYHKLKLMSHMGESECLTDETGNKLATWKTTKRGIRTFLINNRER